MNPITPLTSADREEALQAIRAHQDIYGGRPLWVCVLPRARMWGEEKISGFWQFDNWQRAGLPPDVNKKNEAVPGFTRNQKFLDIGRFAQRIRSVPTRSSSIGRGDSFSEIVLEATEYRIDEMIGVQAYVAPGFNSPWSKMLPSLREWNLDAFAIQRLRECADTRLDDMSWEQPTDRHPGNLSADRRMIAGAAVLLWIVKNAEAAAEREPTADEVYAAVPKPVMDALQANSDQLSQTDRSGELLVAIKAEPRPSPIRDLKRLVQNWAYEVDNETRLHQPNPDAEEVAGLFL